MKPRLDPSPTLFAITLVLATIIHLPALQGQDTATQPHDRCGQLVRCGDIDFEYPFWGLGRPQICGHPSFQITCRSNVPILVLDSVDYRVLVDPDISNCMITIARNDLWDTNCAQNLLNTTYNSTLFNGNNFGQEDVSLYYGCEDDVPGGITTIANNRFSCDANGTGSSDSYFFRASSIVPEFENRTVRCNNSIIVPVNGSWADRLALPVPSVGDLSSALRAGFKLYWKANNDECDLCIQSDGRCGSNATSPDVFVCYCANGDVSLTCNNSNRSGGGSKGTNLKLIIGISCSISGILFLLFVILCRKSRLLVSPKGPEAANDQIEILIRKYGSLAPKRYKYSEIKKMTNTFIDKLGRGGYGSVYKGQLPDGRLVAVKLLSEATGNGEDFINEVASISRTSHVNIVTLIGFCLEGNKRALLYEFMPNGSLDKFLRGNDDFHLDWNTLFQIAKGIARGLEYLHKGCNTRIVHFDIKPHNILLNKEFVPKISDFGLAKLCKTKESIVSVMGARGTAGYMAPEVFFKSLGGASHKSDVYSYGMMVLEMTGANKHNKANSTSTSEAYFPDWIYKQVEAGGNLGDYGVTTKEEEELARKMMIISLWCIQPNPSDRPSISKVMEMLEGSFESLKIPPRRLEPPPAWPFQGTPSSSMHSSSAERVSTLHSVTNSDEAVH